MVKEVGRFNIDFAGSAYDGKIPYEMVIISEFDGNKEIGRKCFYFRVNTACDNTYKIPHFTTEEEVERFYKRKNNARFSVYSDRYDYGIAMVTKYK